MSQVISQLYVDVMARGVEQTKAKMDGLVSATQAYQGVFNQIAGKIQEVAQYVIIPVAAVSASLTGMTIAGFAGTTHMSRLGASIQSINRLMASAFIPLMELGIRAAERISRAIDSWGVNGQRAIIGFTLMSVALTAMLGVMITLGPLTGAIVGVVAAIIAGTTAAYMFHSELRGALGGLWVSIVELGEALKPLLKFLMVIGLEVTRAFVIHPLVNFINYLTLAVHIVAKLTDKVMMLFGTMRYFKTLDVSGGSGDRVMINQTGTENAQQTFQRMQEGALRLEAPSEMQINTNALANLTAKIDEWIARIPNSFDDMIPSSNEIIQGATRAGTGIVDAGIEFITGLMK